MADYPAHLARERKLGDGRTVVIRPIRPEDEVPEGTFYASLSDDARYMRFQKWVRAPSEKLLHFFTHIDYDRHMAFVCAAREDGREVLVGDARYVANADGTSCEFAVAIADDWHKSGIAGLLMAELIRAARAHGFKTMEGLVLRQNSAMLRFVKALGFSVHFEAQEPTVVRVVKEL